MHHIPQQKEYKKYLPKNKRYWRITKAFKQNEKETLIEIKFFIGVAPGFVNYLTMFLSKGPLGSSSYNYQAFH